MKGFNGLKKKGHLSPPKRKVVIGLILVLSLTLFTNNLSMLTIPVRGADHESEIFVPTQSLNFSSEVLSFEVFENCMYVLTADDGVFIYNISDPLEPALISSITFENTTSAGTLFADGHEIYLYLSFTNESLLIYEVSDPLAPQLLISTVINASFSQIVPGESILFGISDDYEYIQYFNISDHYQISLMGNIYGTKIHKIKYDNPYLFIAQDEIGLQIVNFSNMSNPVNQSALKEQLDGYDLALDIPNDIAYLAAGNQGLLAVYLKNISDISVVDRLNYTIPTKNVLLNGSFVFTRYNSGGLSLFHVELPGYPVFVDYFENSETYGQLDVVGTTLYAQKELNQIQIFDCGEIETYLSHQANVKLSTILQVGAFLLVFVILIGIVAKKMSPKYED